MKYLAFRLFGPFASWGDIAVGEHRPTLDGPTKSAVIGLVAGALGWRREDNDEQHIDLDAALGMAAIIHDTGRWMRDFHTAMEPAVNAKVAPDYASRKEEIEWPLERFQIQGAPNGKFNKQALSTDITRRDYRVDALTTLLLWRRDGHAGNSPGLAQIAEALVRPAFVPYLGRKANPLALPMYPVLVEADTLRDAVLRGLEALPTTPFGGRTLTIVSVRYDMDHPAPGLEGNRSLHTRRDRIHSRDTRRWQFMDRQEYHQHWQEGEA